LRFFAGKIRAYNFNGERQAEKIKGERENEKMLSGLLEERGYYFLVGGELKRSFGRRYKEHSTPRGEERRKEREE